jgi:hypothetical protein
MIKIVLLYGLPILLAIYALIDCIQTDESQVRGLPKIGWIVLIVLVGIVGPIAWLIAGRARTGRSRLPLPGSRDRSSPPPRTLAPDDDPEFLGRLGSHNAYDRQLEEWEEELRKRSGDDPPEGDNPDDGPDGPNRPVG